MKVAQLHPASNSIARLHSISIAISVWKYQEIALFANSFISYRRSNGCETHGQDSASFQSVETIMDARRKLAVAGSVLCLTFSATLQSIDGAAAQPYPNRLIQ